MKVFAASTVNSGGDHYLFVSLSKDNIEEQIIEVGRNEYGPESENEYYLDDRDEYLDYEHYLLDQYHITVEDEFDL